MFRRIKNKFLRYIAIAIYAVIILICAVQINFLKLFGYSPTKKDIVVPTQNIATELYTADSVLIGRYFSEDRYPVPYDSISPNVIAALIATEDVRFLSHHGVDFLGLGSGVVSTLTGDKRGASTITQQLAKNLYRTRYNSSAGLLGRIPVVGVVTSKFKEWMTAYKLESQYSKNQILEMYLNTVSFNNNAYGIQTAAIRYFNKSALDLSINEAALLVGMLKGTSLYNPIRNPKNALERRNVVLGQLQKTGKLKPEEVAELAKQGLNLDISNNQRKDGNDSYLRAAVERWLEEWCLENDYDIYNDGLKIYTTIDSKLQKHAEEAVVKQMKVLQRRLDNTWSGKNPWQDMEGNEIPNFLENLAAKTPYYKELVAKYPNDMDSVWHYLKEKREVEVFTWDGPQKKNFSTMDSLRYYVAMLNTGMMSMDPFSGEIKVWVGGIDHTHFKYDHVNQSKRQAGSTFKPFAYLAAIEAGKGPCDQYVDKPVKIVSGTGPDAEVWEPKNADWNFSYNTLTMRQAMARSVNSITVQITEEVGSDKVVDVAHRVGIDSKLRSVPSVSLGPNDVSVFEMVRAYSTFMNRGERTTPILVSKITDFDGKVIATFKPERKQVITEENAWLMTYMLRGGMEENRGTSQALWEWDLFKEENQIGGKTGTSSNYVDGWYMGVTKDLVTGVWVGCDERSIHFTNSRTGEGSKTALPIFATYMESVYKDRSLPYTFGKFPEARVEITKPYKCSYQPSQSREEPEQDSTSFDSNEGDLDFNTEVETEEENNTGEEVDAFDSESTVGIIRIRTPLE